MTPEMISAAWEGGGMTAVSLAVTFWIASRKWTVAIALMLALKGPNRYEKVIRILEIIYGAASKKDTAKDPQDSREN